MKTFYYPEPPPSDETSEPTGPSDGPFLDLQQWFRVKQVQESPRWISVLIEDEDGTCIGWANAWKRKKKVDGELQDVGIMVCIPQNWNKGGGSGSGGGGGGWGGGGSGGGGDDSKGGRGGWKDGRGGDDSKGGWKDGGWGGKGGRQDGDCAGGGDGGKSSDWGGGSARQDGDGGQGEGGGGGGEGGGDGGGRWEHSSQSAGGGGEGGGGGGDGGGGGGGWGGGGSGGGGGAWPAWGAEQQPSPEETARPLNAANGELEEDTPAAAPSASVAGGCFG